MREQVGVSPQLVNIKPVLLTIRQTAPDKRLSTERTLGQLVSIPSRACMCVFVSVTSLEGERQRLTLASVLAWGFAGNWTSVALRIVFSWRMSCWDWL